MTHGKPIRVAIISIVSMTVLLAALLAGITALALWRGYRELQNDAHQVPDIPEPKTVAISQAIFSSLEITDLAGKPAKLPGSGRYRLINYWATWCGPCLVEMPILAEFAQSQKIDGVMVIAIAMDEASEVNAYLRQYPANYPQFLEKSGENDSLARLGNKSGTIPFSVLISPDGRLLKQKRGEFIHIDELEVFAKPPKP